MQSTNLRGASPPTRRIVRGGAVHRGGQLDDRDEDAVASAPNLCETGGVSPESFVSPGAIRSTRIADLTAWQGCYGRPRERDRQRVGNVSPVVRNVAPPGCGPKHKRDVLRGDVAVVSSKRSPERNRVVRRRVTAELRVCLCASGNTPWRRPPSPDPPTPTQLDPLLSSSPNGAVRQRYVASAVVSRRPSYARLTCWCVRVDLRTGHGAIQASVR